MINYTSPPPPNVFQNIQKIYQRQNLFETKKTKKKIQNHTELEMKIVIYTQVKRIKMLKRIKRFNKFNNSLYIVLI